MSRFQRMPVNQTLRPNLSLRLIHGLADLAILIMGGIWASTTYGVCTIVLVGGIGKILALSYSASDASLFGNNLAQFLPLTYMSWMLLTLVGLFPLIWDLLSTPFNNARFRLFGTDGRSLFHYILPVRPYRTYARGAVRVWLWTTAGMALMALAGSTPMFMGYLIDRSIITPVQQASIGVQYLAWATLTGVVLLSRIAWLSEWLPDRAAAFVESSYLQE